MTHAHAMLSDVAQAPGSVPGASAPVYRSTKTYGRSEGLSCCFRQWRADSHCRFLHGYALGFRLVFATHLLDERNWCFDFGGLKGVRSWLKDSFDHTTLVASDDPEMVRFEELARAGMIQMRVMRSVGCEATARFVYDHVARFVDAETSGRVWLESVEVSEHEGNSAVYEGVRHASRGTLPG